jgi:hypothetical protein
VDPIGLHPPTPHYTKLKTKFSRRILFFAHNLCQACNDKAKVYVTSLYVLHKGEKEFYEVKALRRDNFHPFACCTFETVERIYMKLRSKRYNKVIKTI